MSTFNSAVPSSTQTLVVRKDHDGTAVYVRTEDGGRLIAGIVLERTDAPAIALAILEAAQGDNEACDANAHEATVALRTYVVIREAAAKEATDREALEAEARILFDVGTDYLTELSITNRKPLRWDEISETIRAAHVKVAQAAREIHGATK